MVENPGQFTGESLPPVTPGQQKRLLEDLLRGVSRSFYLTLRVLPPGLQQPVGLAYLLGRAADTIADTGLIPPQERLEHLLSFRQQVQGPARPEPLKHIEEALTGKQSLSQERELLSSLRPVFSLLESTAEPDRAAIRSVVMTLTQGMEFDLITFPPEDSGSVAATNDADELERYAYLVAGCVGEFWTSVAMAHTPSLSGWDQERMKQTGVRFGQALQLTNVLRDVPKDLRIGRCYLPRTDLSGVGLTPDDLLDQSTGDSARLVLVGWLNRTLEHYISAEEYLLAIPRRNLRLRLAVLWPILIGLATLAKLARNPSWLDPAYPSRVDRRWVYRTLALSIPAAFSNRLLRGWILRLRRRVEQAL